MRLADNAARERRKSEKEARAQEGTQKVQQAARKAGRPKTPEGPRLLHTVLIRRETIATMRELAKVYRLSQGKLVELAIACLRAQTIIAAPVAKSPKSIAITPTDKNNANSLDNNIE